MRGFNLDKKGNPISLAREWAPEVVSSVLDKDEDGNEVVVEKTVKVEQPANTAYPENFDEILANMLAPEDERKAYVFENNKASELG